MGAAQVREQRRRVSLSPHCAGGSSLIDLGRLRAQDYISYIPVGLLRQRESAPKCPV